MWVEQQQTSAGPAKEEMKILMPTHALKFSFFSVAQQKMCIQIEAKEDNTCDL